jgi:hypothetical protein
MKYKNTLISLVLAFTTFLVIAVAKDNEASEAEKLGLLGLSVQLLLKMEEYREKQ